MEKYPRTGIILGTDRFLRCTSMLQKVASLLLKSMRFWCYISTRDVYAGWSLGNGALIGTVEQMQSGVSLGRPHTTGCDHVAMADL
jgi:hypothetical protein